MLFAVKGNREIKIQDDAAEQFAAQGFDIYDDKGKLKTPSHSKTVSYSEHQRVLKELEELKKAKAPKATSKV